MAHRFTSVATAADIEAGVREARRRMKKRTGGYRTWEATKIAGGGYPCTVEGCTRGSTTYGDPCVKCRDEMVASVGRRLR